MVEIDLHEETKEILIEVTSQLLRRKLRSSYHNLQLGASILFGFCICFLLISGLFKRENLPPIFLD